MYNYGYRDYFPWKARFTTVDPIRDGFNWYAYCNNNPVNLVDVWGLSASFFSGLGKALLGITEGSLGFIGCVVSDTATAYVIANDVTGIGFGDDILLPITLGTSTTSSAFIVKGGYDTLSGFSEMKEALSNSYSNLTYTKRIQKNKQKKGTRGTKKTKSKENAKVRDKEGNPVPVDSQNDFQRRPNTVKTEGVEINDISDPTNPNFKLPNNLDKTGKVILGSGLAAQLIDTVAGDDTDNINDNNYDNPASSQTPVLHAVNDGTKKNR